MTCIYINNICMLNSLHVKHVYVMNIHDLYIHVMYIHFLHIANIRIHDMYSKLLHIYIYIYNVAVTVLCKIFDIRISFQSILANHFTIQEWHHMKVK